MVLGCFKRYEVSLSAMCIPGGVLITPETIDRTRCDPIGILSLFHRGSNKGAYVATLFYFRNAGWVVFLHFGIWVMNHDTGGEDARSGCCVTRFKR